MDQSKINWGWSNTPSHPWRISSLVERISADEVKTTYCVTSYLNPGEGHKFQTNEAALIAKDLFNKLHHSMLQDTLQSWGIDMEPTFIFKIKKVTKHTFGQDLGAVRALVIRAIVGKTFLGCEINNPIFDKIDNLRNKFTDFCYILMWGTGNDGK